MGVNEETRKRALSAAQSLEQQGYFEVARKGDKKAASLFARLTAYTLNPSGNSVDYGWLSKSPGETQVDGFSEDSICYTADPNDLHNVVDVVGGAGAPDAKVVADVKERRPNNLWVKPVALTDEQLEYLRPAGTPIPAPPTSIPSYEAMGGDEGGKKVTRLMEADYKTAGKAGLDGDSGAWQWRTAYDFISGICKTVEESIAKHQPEWRQSLNDERVANGKPPIAW